MKIRKLMIVLVTIALLFTGVVPVSAGPACTQTCGKDISLDEPTPGNTFLDALVYRPAGLVAVPVGAVLFVVSLPFSALGGNVPTAWNNLVATPAKYTFCRPLGDI